jgi:hypothetical protein
MKIKLEHVVLAVVMLVLLPAVVFSSDADVTSVVDVATGESTATIAAGQSEDVTITVSVTGNQVGTATFKIYRHWTLSGGSFDATNAIEFTVPPRAGGDPAHTFSTTATVAVAAGQADGTFPLEVEAFDITNSNETGAKLKARDSAAFTVIVPAAGPALTPPEITMAADTTATATSSSGAVVNFTCTASDENGPVTAVCTPASGTLFPLGTTTVGCSATNSAGPTTGSHQVKVIYGWGGVQQPINADGSSVFKLGSTIPVKFNLIGASAGIDDATATISLRRISATPEGDDQEAVSTAAATTGNQFRYDAANDQYIFNLATRNKKGKTEYERELTAPGEYRGTITLNDGEKYYFYFSLK